jgi:phosphoglycerate dehydrogenase-like enzyme
VDARLRVLYREDVVPPPRWPGDHIEEAISAINPGAYFVNVGRGQLVDEGALIEALRSKRLSGAALDMFEEEPLPEESLLWDLENVTVSPYSTDNVPGLTNELQTDFFRGNLRST